MVRNQEIGQLLIMTNKTIRMVIRRSNNVLVHVVISIAAPRLRQLLPVERTQTMVVGGETANPRKVAVVIITVPLRERKTKKEETTED